MAPTRQPVPGDLNGMLFELLRELGDVKRELGETNGKINTFIAQMAVQDTRVTDVEVRLRKVENRQHWYSGIGAAIGMLLGFGGARSLIH